jgi:triacylglycerol esterase/lipase EstA (alpha/beta hydrolase family)
VKSSLLRGLATAAVASLLGAGAMAAPAQAADKYPVGDVGTSLVNFFNSPDAVAGANDWNCKPSAEHPTPVVLVHATFVNLGTNWSVLAPMLANEGYCVFGFNYGMTQLSYDRIGGLGDIAESAKTLDAFVDKVLAATGATQVDLVGHSQGGMMPNYYIKRLGGASKVRTFVALAPSNHGTTMLGIVNLGKTLNLLGFANQTLNDLGAPGLVQQEQDSDFQTALFADGDTVPGPRYVVIETKNDIVVTPYTNAWLKGDGVTNILVQDQCPDDYVGHVGMFNDSPVMQDVLNQLGANVPGFTPTCNGYGLPV